MPEPSLRFVSYAVGASLAAAALIYVIAPPVSSSTGPIGLKNRANDCFINSVLQALAGIPELREYLIRETHRRAIEPATYGRLWRDTEVAADMTAAGSEASGTATATATAGREGITRSKRLEWQIWSEQQGEVTRALKLMLDALNQKPPSRKSISPDMFIQAMENAFRLRVSRQQQDAHEFLQIVSQRLEEEFQAGHAARRQAETGTGGEGAAVSPPAAAASLLPVVQVDEAPDERDVFPMQGAYQRQLACKSCGFKTKPVEEGFTIMTVNVPQVSSISLDECIRQHLMAEDIDDFKCAKCRLEHCRDALGAQMERARAKNRAGELGRLAATLAKVDDAIGRDDPDSLAAEVALPDEERAPLRRITKTSRISQYPAVLMLHLSRSIYSNVSRKNLARVSFGELLEMGTLGAPQSYRLLAVITHRGDHYSGHYETFRRQSVAAPYPNKNTFQPAGVYSRVGSRAASRATSPSRNAVLPLPLQQQQQQQPPLLEPPDHTESSTPPPETSPAATSPSPFSSADVVSGTTTPQDSSASPAQAASGTSTPRPSVSSALTGTETSSLQSVGAPTISETQVQPDEGRDSKGTKARKMRRKSRKGANPDKWWRISDDKVKESETREALDTQRDVYMLFYELVKSSVAPRRRPPPTVMVNLAEKVTESIMTEGVAKKPGLEGLA